MNNIIRVIRLTMSDYTAAKQPFVHLQRLLDNCTELRYRRIRSDGEYGPPLRRRHQSSHDTHHTTAMCGKRGCKWCDYKYRRRHLPKMRRLEELIQEDPGKWRLFTFTHPGENFPIRKGGLLDQLVVMRRALTRWRDRQRDPRGTHWARLGKITGSYVIEHPYNSENQWWHLHTHAIIRVPGNFDDSFDCRVARYNRQWLECIDKDTYKLLKDKGEPVGSPLDIERVTDDKLGSYLTKATGYLSKGQGGHAMADEVSRIMAGKPMFNTWGNLRGTKYGRI